MKLVILMMLFCSVLLESFAQKGYFLQVSVNSAADGTKVFLVNNVNGDTLSRSVIGNGRCIFRGVLSSTPEWYSVRFEKMRGGRTLLLENRKIRISGAINNWEHAKVDGSVLTNQEDTITGQIEIFNGIRNLIDKNYNAARKLNDSGLANQLKYHLDHTVDSFKQYIREFICQHSNSAYIPWLILHTPVFDDLHKEKVYNGLSRVVKISNYGLQLKQYIDDAKVRKDVGVGQIIPDFGSLTPGGQTIRLKDIVSRNKLTLIDFWASWCLPCREETPNLRRVYANFHAKGFGILSVSLDDKASSWIKAIESDSLIWPQVSQLKGRDEDASKLFGINGIPASILVDGDGRILAIDASGAKIPSSDGSLRGDSLRMKVTRILN
jgi:thiol-disulfide isomerase/thioredoxin